MSDTRKRILTEYLEYMKFQNRPIAERKSTLLLYFRYLDEQDIDFLRPTVPQAQDFQRHLAMLPGRQGVPYYATATVIAMMGRITSFYGYLKMKKLVPYNPFTEIARFRGEKSLPREILSAEELGGVLLLLKRFMKGRGSAGQRRLYKAHVIAELMYSTGARIHEIARLTVAEVNFGRGVVLLCDAKTGVQRYGILNEYAGRVLRLYVEETREYVLTGRSDRRLLFGSFLDMRRLINEVMSEACGQKGFKRFTSHAFRHCMASHLLKNGCDIRYIQEMLGHESIGSTQIYTRVVKEDLRGVIDEYHPRKLKV